MKKNKQPERKAGIWVDQENAYVVHLSGDQVEKVDRLVSDVESRVRIPGEGKVYARFGRAFIDNQEKTQQRQRNQRGRFYKDIIAHLQGEKYIYVFGPGRTRYGLRRAIEKIPALAGHIVSLTAADKMNRAAVVSATLDYFSGTDFRQYKKDLKRVQQAAG